MSISGSINAILDLVSTGSPDLGSAEYKARLQWGFTLTNGSGLNQANKIFQDTVSLVGSGSQAYDLDGALTGPLGETVTFARIMTIAIQRTDTPTATTQDENLLISGDFILTKFLVPGGDTLSLVTIPVRPGGLFLYVAPDATGVAITATTGDGLTLTNASSADTVNFNIVILGS